MKTKSTTEWKERLDDADVPNGGVNDLMGVVRDPYLNEAGFFQKLDHPTEGLLTTMPFPVNFSETVPDRNEPPAHLGEHTESTLRELGFDADEIAAIRD
jgi:crotonobetainyl-CoA:carnitine CoA-transferase CaiB-like acyl-CoA transferase